jgi:hypothetical protein
MADIPASQQLICAVIGSVVTLAGKYVIDRFTESHKAAVSVAAKRRERFYEKQAAAIAGTYERLARCTEAACGLYISESDLSSGELSEWKTQKLKEDIDKAEQARRDFSDYFAANMIYFPRSLAPKVEKLGHEVQAAIGLNQIAILSKPLGLPVTEKDLASMKAAREAARELLAELQDRFREMMLRDEPPWYSAIWMRMKSPKKGQKKVENQQARSR